MLARTLTTSPRSDPTITEALQARFPHHCPNPTVLAIAEGVAHAVDDDTRGDLESALPLLARTSPGFHRELSDILLDFTFKTALPSAQRRVRIPDGIILEADYPTQRHDYEFLSAQLGTYSQALSRATLTGGAAIWSAHALKRRVEHAQQLVSAAATQPDERYPLQESTLATKARLMLSHMINEGSDPQLYELAIDAIRITS